MISNVGKMSYREQIFRINYKISVLLLVELVRKEQISHAQIFRDLDAEIGDLL